MSIFRKWMACCIVGTSALAGTAIRAQAQAPYPSRPVKCSRQAVPWTRSRGSCRRR
jgi:hypothetical protein